MNEQTLIRVLTVDDHPLLREGIASIVAAQADMTLVGQAADANDGIRQFRQHKPDITLMDLRLPGSDGIEALMTIRAEFPNARIIMLSTFQGDADIQRALAAGARGFLLKTMPPNELLACIRQVHSGRKYVPAEVAVQLADHYADDALTPREVEVLQLIAAGNRNRDVADALSISEDTVKVHVKHVMEKLAANDRTEAVTIALRRGIIHL